MKKSKLLLIFLSCAIAFGCATSGNTNSSVVINSQSDSPVNPEPAVEDSVDFAEPADNFRANEIPVNDSGLPSAETVNSFSEAAEEPGENLFDTALNYCDVSQAAWTDGNFDDAIDALDKAYNLILSVNTEDNPKLMQQKEDLRFMISKRILEIYASRYTAVNGSHEAIPLVMNKYVEREIQLFRGPERDFFINAYKRSGIYREKITDALRSAGMPEELSWLPLIESGFKVRALSSARALGLWQFIPSTGYKFGLKRDTWVDERLDPDKSTTAAISYLTELHNIFGDWSTVLAAYNCGEGRVLKLIRDQQINYFDNFWDLYEKLPSETARYFPRFLATLHIIRDPEKFGFTREELGEVSVPGSFKLVIIDKPLQLKTIASVLNLPLESVTDLNPELRSQATPPKPYSLKVPESLDNILLSKLYEIPTWYPSEKSYVYHKVKNGETLSMIAAKFRISVEKITAANNIKKKNVLRVGQSLKIPLGGDSGTAITAYSEIPSDGLYRVSKGDSLLAIAKKFNTDTETLKRINELETSQLKIGQVLKLTDVKQKSPSDTRYRVKKGDTLWLIAKKYNTDTKSLQRLNNLQDTSLKVGQVLKVN
ncbi:MAG: LysM peptidoglycan-binding domain-containing protein [Nitrospirae bacterium]|nr:LysM peptidoglycan-binding domain-containing protein [Nitrospirota bacterium]